MTIFAAPFAGNVPAEGLEYLLTINYKQNDQTVRDRFHCNSRFV